MYPTSLSRRALRCRLSLPSSLPDRPRTGIAGRALVTLALASAATSPAFAHCFIGSRFFPANITTDDPCVVDELALPTISQFATGYVPAIRQTDYAGEFSKRITEDFGVSVGRTLTHLAIPGGQNVTGFQNLETTFKYQYLTLPRSEFVASAAVSVEWGRTGRAAIGAERFSTVTPTLTFGKGFGNLPASSGWLRAFAVTGQLGYSIPAWSRTLNVSIDPDSGDVAFDEERNARVLRYGGTLQFSMPYLRANVVDLELPDVFNRLVPIVEATFSTPVANTRTSGRVTRGSINPGIIFAADKFQIGAEAIIPVNRASGKGVGWVAQLHFYIDSIFPMTLGRAIVPVALAEIGR